MLIVGSSQIIRDISEKLDFLFEFILRLVYFNDMFTTRNYKLRMRSLVSKLGEKKLKGSKQHLKVSAEMRAINKC